MNTVNLADLCALHQINCTAKRIASNPSMNDATMRHFEVELRFQDRKLVTPFSQGSAHKDFPRTEAVLSCLILDGSCGRESFEEFCSSMGYDPDSRKAEATWKACVQTDKELDGFLDGLREEFERAEY